LRVGCWDGEAQPVSIRQRFERVDALVALAVALPAIPIIVAVVRAISQRWIPIGDQALLEIRARDVLTAHHPLLGTASSAALSGENGVALNHPGPLMFDVLTLPVRVFGGGAGKAGGLGGAADGHDPPRTAASRRARNRHQASKA